MSWTTVLSAAALLVTIAGAIGIWRGARGIPRLSRVEPAPPANGWPKVSVIVAARDEADTLKPALRSLLALDYPRLEVIVVNDRSSDATATILNSLAADDSRLQVLHIHDLPDGWLGKTHALHRGAECACGEYLLFTDADVHMARTTLRLAIRFMLSGRLDHLVVLPRIVADGALLRMTLIMTLVSLLALFRPWATQTHKKRFMGVGAFNLVRRQAYTACGGHRPLAMTPVDDIELGRLIKYAGYAQAIASGDGMVRVEWYPSITALVHGLEKNAFAIFGFRARQLLPATLLVLVIGIWPWAGLIVTDGLARWLNAATLALSVGFYAEAAHSMNWQRRCVVALPAATLLILFTWWRSAALALLRGGIIWRGTLYPLDRLRQAHARRRR